MKPGRKPTRITLTPFQHREPDGTYSTASIRVSRCNLCGAFRVWPYQEHVVKNGVVLESVNHPGVPVNHQPGCPAAEAGQE